MDNKRNFYISGFIALSLFLLFFTLAITMLFSPLHKTTFALKKATYISVSIVMPKIKQITKKMKQKSSQASTLIITQDKPIDINNLFSDVWTKKIVHKKKIHKTLDNRIIKQLQKKVKKSAQKSNESFSDKMKTLKNTISTQEQVASSSAQEVNEYLAKIQAIVYQYFNVPHNSEGYSIKAVIELDAFGKFLDFRILHYSQNELLNNEADKIKNRIKNVIFPKNPKNVTTRTIVVLISKE